MNRRRFLRCLLASLAGLPLAGRFFVKGGIPPANAPPENELLTPFLGAREEAVATFYRCRNTLPEYGENLAEEGWYRIGKGHLPVLFQKKVISHG